MIALLPEHEHVRARIPGYGGVPLDQIASIEVTAARIATEASDAVVVGHSLGGVLATLIAERTPVRGVVNIEGNLSRGDCTFSAQALAYTADAFTRSGLADVRAGIANAGDAALRGYHAALGECAPVQFHAHAVELVKLSESRTLAPRFAALACPTLYLAGTPDGICEYSLQLLVEHQIRHERVAPAGHWPFVDQPARCAELIVAFTAFVTT